VTNPENAESTLARLLLCEWKEDKKYVHSHIALLGEYFRRMALWAKALDVIDKWWAFDVAYHIDPSIRANPRDIEQLSQHISGKLPKKRRNAPGFSDGDIRRALVQ